MRTKSLAKGAMPTRPLRDAVLAADPAALGRAITLAERYPDELDEAIGDVRALAGRAFRVGVTGPPGAGKSSILREVIRRLLEGGERAALVACDPPSPVTGGAFLGDRLRPVRRCQHRIPVCFECGPSDLKDHCLIIGNKDEFAVSSREFGLFGGIGLLALVRLCRKINKEFAPLARFAVNIDEPAMAFYNTQGG